MFTAILELIFIILKIILLSTVYTSFVLLIIYFISVNNNNILKIIINNKLRFWLTVHFIISLSLFIYKFSYWQNTGLGENSIIPIGYNQTIQNEDLQSTYFYPDIEKTDPNKDGIEIENYIIKNDYLCAETSQKNDIPEQFDYFVFNLSEKKLIKFKNKNDYQTYANKKNYHK